MNEIQYKREEERHYDSVYENRKIDEYQKYDDFGYADKCLYGARLKCEKLAKDYLDSLNQALVLDYGCAIGEKTFNFISESKKVIGIDISSLSVKIANEIAKKNYKNSEYKVMDCENIDFPDNTFDMVYNYGTLSSLNVNNAISEIYRVLKPGGVFISIETLGNNPIFILKRYLNVFRGKRTKWAVSHILKLKDWKAIKKQFKTSEQYFFGITTPFLVPFLTILPKRFHYRFVRFFEKIDKVLIYMRAFNFLSFKKVVKLNK